jgi:hypothetical protein
MHAQDQDICTSFLWMDGKRLGISSPEIHAAPVFHHRIYSTVY